MTKVEINTKIEKKVRHPILAILKDAEPDGDLEDALRYWNILGGPNKSRWLLSEPGASAKSRKSVRPEYMLYLTPHRLSNTVNLCPWSTAGCRKDCLHHAGRGAQPNVQHGRMVRTQLLVKDPVAFLTILDYNLRLIEKRGGGWVRLNGTSDIPWEEVPAVAGMMERYAATIDFADYTKASPQERPTPTIKNYRLARSVWPGKQDAFDIKNLIEQGEKVSAVVDEPKHLKGREFVTMADDTDEWLLKDGAAVGVLKPKGKLRRNPEQYYSWKAIDTAVVILEK